MKLIGVEEHWCPRELFEFVLKKVGEDHILFSMDFRSIRRSKKWICAKERAEIIVDPMRKSKNILEKAGCSHKNILPFPCLYSSNP